MKVRNVLILVTSAMLIGASGCAPQMMSEPVGNDEPQTDKLDTATLLALFNADLGDEGVEVTQAQVDQVFGDDDELTSAVRKDLLLMDLASLLHTQRTR